jgi:hypothetical protein
MWSLIFILPHAVSAWSVTSELSTRSSHLLVYPSQALHDSSFLVYSLCSPSTLLTTFSFPMLLTHWVTPPLVPSYHVAFRYPYSTSLSLPAVLPLSNSPICLSYMHPSSCISSSLPPPLTESYLNVFSDVFPLPMRITIIPTIPSATSLILLFSASSHGPPFLYLFATVTGPIWHSTS